MKSKTKKSITTFIVGMMAVQALAGGAYGQTAGVIVGGTRGGAFVGAPGSYDVNQVTQDNTAIMRDILARTANVADQDRQYLMSVVERLNGLIKEMIVLQTQFNTLAANSATQEIKLKDYLALANQIKAKDAVMQAEIAANTLISRETLPSYNPVQVGNVNASVATAGNINMKPVMERFEALRTKLVAEMRATTFGLITTDNEFRQPVRLVDGLTPNLKGLMLLSSKQIQEQTTKVRQLLVPTQDTVDLNQGYTDLLVTQINEFVKSYGVDESWRFTDENDKLARETAYSTIVDAFYYRSYLRKKYGIRLGAMQPARAYEKSFANFDRFSLKILTNALQSYSREAAMSDAELLRAFESTRNFVQTLDEKVTPVFKSGKEIMSASEKKEDFMSKDTGFLVRANSAVTFLSGASKTAEVMLAVMRLVLADIREEMLLSKFDHAGQIASHNMRYRSTDDLKRAANLKICQMDHKLYKTRPQDYASACGALGVRQPVQGGFPGKSFAGIFQNLLEQFEGPEKSRKQDAIALQQLIDAAQAALGGDDNSNSGPSMLD